MKNDIAYPSDIFVKFNTLNLSLQGNEVNLSQVESALSGFKNKLALNQQNSARREFFQFSSLPQLDTSNNGNVDVETYVQQAKIQEMHEDMQVQFQDVFQLEIPNRVIHPLIKISEQGIFAEELITLQNDFELKPKFSVSLQSFWPQSGIRVKYPYMWDQVKIIFIAFSSLYLVEHAFSAVTVLLNHRRNRLDIVRQGDLQLLMTKIEPDIKKLTNCTKLILLTRVKCRFKL